MAATRRKAPAKRAAANPDLRDMVISHDRALFGYTDRETLRVVPGLLEQIRDAHKDISGVKTDVADVKVKTKDVPEVVSLAKGIKKWGGIGTAAIIALLLAVVFHQFNIIPTVLHLLTP